MRKMILSVLLLTITTTLFAQIEVVKLVDKEASQYGLGFGAFLHFAFPVSDADYLSFEAAAKFIGQKEDKEYGMAVVPLKVGYRYTFDRSGTGFYIEPQAGYNVYGVKSVYIRYNYEDVKFHGIVGAINAGYLFKPSGKIQFDLRAFYESIFYNGGPTQYIGLRLSHNFIFGSRSEE